MESTYKYLFNHHPVPILLVDADTYNILDANEASTQLYLYDLTSLTQLSLADLFFPADYAIFIEQQTRKKGFTGRSAETWVNIKQSREKFFAEINSNDVKTSSGKPVKVVSVLDVTKKVLSEESSMKLVDSYKFLSEETFDAIWEWDLIKDKLTWNKSAKEMFAIADEKEIEHPFWWSSNLHPEDKDRVEEKLYYHINNSIGKWKDEYRFKSSDGTYKYISDRGYLVFDTKNKPIRMIGAMQDLTAYKDHEATLQTLNNSLEKRAKELAESNEELERFAYVASHDLQEPLRMVTSFLQLLQRRYENKLDDKANEYISYAVDGAERMKKLILDLLEYSRVNTAVVEREDVNLNEILGDILFTYAARLSQSFGHISSDSLPIVRGNKTQLLQLFQNLIGNAFKYRSERPPEIKISCEEENIFYKFAITDNGIGIDPRFYSKIFVIFQRLHTRQKYSGTGIGLSICKKIVDKHGGKIWVASTPGQGSTFYFTLPKS